MLYHHIFPVNSILYTSSLVHTIRYMLPQPYHYPVLFSAHLPLVLFTFVPPLSMSAIPHIPTTPAYPCISHPASASASLAMLKLMLTLFLFLTAPYKYQPPRGDTHSQSGYSEWVAPTTTTAAGTVAVCAACTAIGAE